MTPLVVGALLAVIGLVLVLYPLFDDLAPRNRVSRVRESDAPGVEAVQALREIEFDRETGKLSDGDYNALKTRYTREAVAAFRDQDAGLAGSQGDAAEAVVLQYRRRAAGCAVHGPRPESDAIYCSACGLYLAGSCGHCSAPITEIGAQYCASCGESFAA
ncbi:MAG: zinc ribbon domain-containing protein [Gemmatimonadaceae bacterium]